MDLSPHLVLEILIAATAAALGLILLRAKPLPRMLSALFGIVIVGAGIAALVVVELRYSQPGTDPISMPLTLDRAAEVAVPAFVAPLSGPYDIWLRTDRSIGILRFGCLTGDDGFESLCPGEQPQLNVSWVVEDGAVAVAHGGSDSAGWRRRQAALDPRYAALRLRAFKDYNAKSENPSDGSPLYHQLGAFHALAGHSYRLILALHKPAPDLAVLHPRLMVGLGGEATKGLGVFVLGYCLLCAAGGGFLLLRAFAPRKASA